MCGGGGVAILMKEVSREAGHFNWGGCIINTYFTLRLFCNTCIHRSCYICIYIRAYLCLVCVDDAVLISLSSLYNTAHITYTYIIWTNIVKLYEYPI